MKTKSPKPEGFVHREHHASSMLTLRIRMPDKPDSVGKVTTAVGQLGLTVASFNSPCLVGQQTEFDLSVYLKSASDGDKLCTQLKKLRGLKIRNVSNPNMLSHLGGAVKVVPRRQIENAEDLSRVYTPGVAEVCRAIQRNQDSAWNLTSKGNSILVVTDGSRILGLGNIGPYAGAPVMGGKAAIFAQFGEVNAVPMPLDTQNADEIIQACVWMAPGYGGINLEDIESPKCWYIEEQLKKRLDIPVFHDDQHGTAIAVLAAALNAARRVGKKLSDMKVVLSGVGAAGMATGLLLLKGGARNVIGFKKEGAIYRGREDMNPQEQVLAKRSNPENFSGTLEEAMAGADLFIGLSAAGVIDANDVKRMAKDAIVFALANPVPEIDPLEAARYARIVATGSSEYPNQVNNALVFPGLFRGALDARVREITEKMQLAAARALARVIKPSLLRDHQILPDVFDERAHQAVRRAVFDVAHRTGHARRDRKVR